MLYPAELRGQEFFLYPAGVELNELKPELGLLVMEEQERHTRNEMRME